MTAAKRAPLLRPEPGPDTLKATRWGGERLGRLRGAPAGAQIGESWELSTLAGRESRAGGRALDAWLGAPLPFLAKLIDTALPLSVQVHPGDRADAPGKEEAWMILDAAPGARLWAGLAPGSDRDRVAAAAARARADRRHEDALFAELRAIDARPGTVILVPAGTLHAIGGGILLAEIQQPSDCTYRLYDYQSGRELHVDAALDALAVDAQATVWSPGDPPRTLRGAHLDLTPLGPGEHALAVADPTLVVLLAGAATIDDERLVAGDLALLLPGEARISVEAGGLAIVGGCDRARAG